MQEIDKLDNPVWFSLSETHKPHALEDTAIKFYHPDYCPFGGITDDKDVTKQIDDYSALADDFFIVGNKPKISNRLKLNRELVCLQMIITERIKVLTTENIVQLRDAHAEQLFELVDLVQPGYFRKTTRLLGDYFGIFKRDKLVAATGERMKMNNFTEVSAVVTHPDHTGRGYAKQLIAHTVNKIFDQDKTPYLHVLDNNVGAISLYEKLGFQGRRKISFWNITR